MLDHRKSKRATEKHLLLIYWLCQSIWLCGSQQNVCSLCWKLWKILKEMGIPDHLTCLLRDLYADQETVVRTRHGTMGNFQTGKGVCQNCILSLCLFNLYAEYIKCEMRSWMKHKLESRLPRKILISSVTQMTLPLWQKAKN